LRFTVENLGEVEPGLLYRSARTSPALLEFLAERCNLGYVVNLRGKNDPHEVEFVESIGGELIQLEMSSRRPPAVRQVLELIRVTHRARAGGRSILVHCHGGSDRTGMMVAIWRMLFQGADDRDALTRETFLYRHLSFRRPNVRRLIELYRPELFLPFVEDPALIDDEERVAELESRFFRGYPLASGRALITRGPLRAGAAKADLLEGWSGEIPMASYGPYPPPAVGIREPVFARAIVLEGGDLRLAIVSCDLLIIDRALRETALAAIARRGVKIDDLLLAATHTHTSVGGYIDSRAFEFYILGRFDAALRLQIADRVADAVERAAASTRDARAGAGRAFAAGLSFNRRIGETVDPEVGILRITDRDGGPLAVIVNFAGHPILEPADRRISPDYPGRLARMLDERHGFGLFLAGALGDLNAQPPGRPGAWREEGLAEEVAQGVFRAVDGEIAAIETREEVALGSMTAWVDLAPPDIPLIPDLLAPLDWLAVKLIGWKRRYPLQSVRVGDAALVATASEIGCRVGLRIKRRSPAPFPFVVVHAGDYAGYAVAPPLHALSKIDATSLVALHGASHGARIVEAACEILERQWEGEMPPSDTIPLSPAARARVEKEAADASGERRREIEEAASREEERGLLLDVDPTRPQSRRIGARVADSALERLRAEVTAMYLEDVRGGTRQKGRTRELRARVFATAPGEMRFDLAAGYRRSDWDGAGTGGESEGATDLEIGAQIPLTLGRDDIEGSAWRLIPRIELAMPTADADPDAPLAFAAGSGVWRPAAAAALEYTWDSYHTLAAEAGYRTAIDRHRGRRPGDRIETALRYTERHGMASLHLALAAAVQLPDRRSGGLRPVDVEETSFDLSLEPALSIHIGGHLDLHVEGRAELARGGSGGGCGHGVLAGLLFAW
ncbi:MAG: neutral/alkaline non-lysosomal ceramidase N-terminal domain-containing protein, partial [Planctomycetes bacterium]|nr:neutral/alkaline non-lysosomal ceramidase N-terminal domain-containing protein [Planctomycetota bacterium]